MKTDLTLPLRAVAAIFLCSILAGCGGIRILGLKQDGSRDCPANERVYLYRDVRVGLCLKQEVVHFTHCVSELGLSKSEYESGVKLGLTVSGIERAVGSVSVTPEQKVKIIRELASTGEREKAIADAIRACIAFSGLPVQPVSSK